MGNGSNVRRLTTISIAQLAFLMLPFCSLASFAQDVAVPNVFSPGSTISASQMNANFGALVEGINATRDTVGADDLTDNVISDLSDVDTTTTPPAAGQVLKWDGSQWVPGADDSGGADLWEDQGSYIYPSNAADVVVTDTGTVGIGTASPGATLTIRGLGSGPALNVTNQSGESLLYVNSANDNVGINTTSPARRLVVVEELNGSYAAEFDSTYAGANVYGVMVDIPSSTDGRAFFVRTSGLPRLLVQNDGKVGIGTSSPAGTLDVNGTIYQRGAQIHADEVFSEGYAVQSIAEHAKYMWSEKHLPAVPPSKKDENGMDIVEYGSHLRGILEELEKAHVYIEQLLQRIDRLEARIESLEETD